MFLMWTIIADIVKCSRPFYDDHEFGPGPRTARDRYRKIRAKPSPTPAHSPTSLISATGKTICLNTRHDVCESLF